MQIFSVSLGDYASEFATRGFIALKDVVRADFLAWVRERAQAALAVPSRYDLPGKKRQVVFPFDAEGPDFETAFRAPLAALFGTTAAGLTLSERHYNAYLPEAPPEPVPHKDRRASEFSVGIPVVMPPDSRLLLYPDCHREPNVYDSASEWRRSLAPDQRPEVLLKAQTPVLIDSRPGDLVAFSGSSMFHERRQPAGAEILYLKFNREGLDPLGEELR